MHVWSPWTPSIHPTILGTAFSLLEPYSFKSLRDPAEMDSEREDWEDYLILRGRGVELV